MKNSFFTAVVCTCLFLTSHNALAQNIIESDLSQWVAGQTGATSSFGEFGGINERITTDGPFGTPVTVWSAASIATTAGTGQSGGWIHTGFQLSTTKTYRIAFWMKSTGTTVCNNNAGFYTQPPGGGNVEPLRIETNMTPRYWPSVYNGELPTDKWVLIVGYLYSRNATTFDLESGVFDPLTYDGSGTLPAPILSTYNHRFPDGHDMLNVRLRNDLWDCQLGEVQYSYMPRIEEVTGSEPSILELLALTSNSSGSVWSESNSVANYAGKAQIGSGSVPSEYQISVDGKLITEEVRVELSQDWPDYVFENDYELLSLEEVEKYISENGHLPEMSPAKHMATTGLSLGEMNRLLLQKVEELTLYILEQENQILELEKKTKNTNHK